MISDSQKEDRLCQRHNGITRWRDVIVWKNTLRISFHVNSFKKKKTEVNQKKKIRGLKEVLGRVLSEFGCIL